MKPPVERPTQYISFSLAGATCAVDIRKAREIVPFEAITRVPAAPTGIRGVINLRGRVVPVVDLALRLGLQPAEPTRWTCILMVDVELDREPSLMGVMIDAVSDVIDLSPDDVEPPPPFGTRVRLDYLVGVGKVDKEIILLLDLDQILSPGELAAAALLPEGAGGLAPAELPSAPVPGEAPPS